MCAESGRHSFSRSLATARKGVQSVSLRLSFDLFRAPCADTRPFVYITNYRLINPRLVNANRYQIILLFSVLQIFSVSVLLSDIRLLQICYQITDLLLIIILKFSGISERSWT